MITGTLKYVTGYTGFSGDEAEQSGHYLALAFTLGDGESLTASIGDRGPVDLTEDGYLVLRLTEDDLANKLVLVASKGGESETFGYDLSGIVLEEES